jgi:hypothetical protein
MTAGVAVAEEYLKARPPVVVSGTLGVEAGDLRSLADQGRCVAQPGELVLKQRADFAGVELAGELEAGDERGRHAGDPAGSPPSCRLVFRAGHGLAKGELQVAYFGGREKRDRHGE